MRQGLGYFFSNLLACGWIFSFFLLSCSLPFPQRCGSLQICLSGEERQEPIWGVLVRDQGSREGHCNSGNKKTRAHSLIVSLGRGRLSLSSFLLRLQGRLLTSVQLLALKSIPPGDCKRLSLLLSLLCNAKCPFLRALDKLWAPVRLFYPEAALLSSMAGGWGWGAEELSFFLVIHLKD